jgi:sugar O-acyltransferase (sialic acid O-acetyltransferase NeuD family)
MLIIGAGGFAKELLEVVCQDYERGAIFFYDDLTTGGQDYLYDQFKIIRTIQEAAAYFKNNNAQFALGMGNPQARLKMTDQFEQIGGELKSIISRDAKIGSFGNSIQNGVTIMQGVKITNSITIGKGCLINLDCTIGHDTIIGDYCELSPGVHISGNCKIGAFSNIGTNAILLPGITLGKNVIVGAGAVVTKNLPDNVTAVGVPANIILNMPQE